VRARPDLSGLFLEPEGQYSAPKASLLAPLGISVIDWLCCIAAVVTSLYVPWVFHDLAFRVGNPDPIDWMMGTVMIGGCCWRRHVAASAGRCRSSQSC